MRRNHALVEIRTMLNTDTRQDYKIVVIADGNLQAIHYANAYNVTHIRNHLCESWSETARTVQATPIPDVPILKQLGGRK